LFWVCPVPFRCTADEWTVIGRMLNKNFVKLVSKQSSDCACLLFLCCRLKK
jgi:hypothetical protein